LPLPFPMVMPMPSVVQYKRTAIRRTWPPADHNIPGLPTLSPEEIICVEQAREALARMKQTFAGWVAVARALKALETKAARMSGRTFARLCEREGFGSDVLNRGRIWKLRQILERLPAVEAWRNTLSAKQQFKWASPESVLRYCPPAVREAEASTVRHVAHRADRQRRRHRHGSGRHVFAAQGRSHLQGWVGPARGA
jgi:hypothetical protein